MQAGEQLLPKILSTDVKASGHMEFEIPPSPEDVSAHIAAYEAFTLGSKNFGEGHNHATRASLLLKHNPSSALGFALMGLYHVWAEDGATSLRMGLALLQCARCIPHQASGELGQMACEMAEAGYNLIQVRVFLYTRQYPCHTLTLLLALAFAYGREKQQSTLPGRYVLLLQRHGCSWKLLMLVLAH